MEAKLAIHETRDWGAGERLTLPLTLSLSLESVPVALAASVDEPLALLRFNVVEPGRDRAFARSGQLRQLADVCGRVIPDLANI